MAHAFLNISSAIEVKQRCKKTPWESRKMAFRARGRFRQSSNMVESGTGNLQVYKCSICGQWHLGHKSR